MVDSATMSQSHGSRAYRSTLIKAQFSALDTAAEGGRHKLCTSMRTTNREGLIEAADCDGM